MIPEPQIPVTPVAEVASAKPSSSDHGSAPMTRKRGSPVSRSIRTRSIAPAVARWPLETCAPSKAGPVGLEAARIRPWPARTISALVPTSTTRSTPGDRWGPVASTTAAVSAPTCPAIQGRTWARAAGWTCSARSAAGRSTASSISRVNGATPSGVGLSPRNRWCMIGLPTRVSSRTSSRVASASWQSSPIRPSIAARTEEVSSTSPPGFIITYDTRLMRSSPKRI